MLFIIICCTKINRIHFGLLFTRKNIFSETQRRSKAWREETVEIQMKRKVLFVFDNRQLVFKWQSSGLRNLCWRAHVFILIMSGSCYNDLQGDGNYLNVLLFLRSSVYVINTESHIVPYDANRQKEVSGFFKPRARYL